MKLENKTFTLEKKKMVNFTFGTNDVYGTFDIADRGNMHTAYHTNLANGLARQLLEHSIAHLAET